jgi:hypothetical protein
MDPIQWCNIHNMDEEYEKEDEQKSIVDRSDYKATRRPLYQLTQKNISSNYSITTFKSKKSSFIKRIQYTCLLFI